MSNTVTLYLDTLKDAVLDIPNASEAEQKENERIFEDRCSAYVDYVRKELASEGFDLVEGKTHGGRSYTVEADSAAKETRAHQMMSDGEVMGFWEWFS